MITVRLGTTGRAACVGYLLTTATGSLLAPPSAAAPVPPRTDAFQVSVAAVGIPGATRGFLVRPNSIFNGEWRITVVPEPGLSDSIERSLAVRGGAGGVPTAGWTWRSGEVEWQGSVVPAPSPRAGDSLIVASIEMRARNAGPKTRAVALTFRLAPAETERAFTAFDAVPVGSEGEDLVNGWCGAPATGSDAVFHENLAPGRIAAFRILMPSSPAPRRLLQDMAETAHAEHERRFRADWLRRFGSGMRIELGDEEVELACRQSLAILLGAWERRDEDVLPIGGPFHYRDIWVRDGARVIVGLALWGYTELSRQLSRGLLSYQWPQGFIMSQRGQPDGTGQALWAVEQSHLRGENPSVPAQVMESTARAWRWFERQRAYAGPGITGVQPFATPNDNEGVRAQLVGTDFWAMAGYRATGRLARGAGAGSLADSVRTTMEHYRGIIQERLASFEDIPPSWQGCGWDWGNVSAVFPCDVLAPSDPRVERLAARLWARVGGAGLCAYGNLDSLHYYYGSDLANWALLAHRPASADSVLKAMLYWRTASGGAPELFSQSRQDFGTNLPPHCTSAAVLLTLVRNMLVYDDGDTLRLTLGAREAWWKRGASVRNAPTRWGNIDVRFARRGTVAEWRWSAVPVWTRLNLPPGTEGSLDGKTWGVRELHCPPGRTTARIRVRAAS